MGMDARDASESIGESMAVGAKRLALLIALLAALLAVVEMAGGNAEQDALGSNIDASNLWSFYQAKTIRQTTLKTAAEILEEERALLPPDRQVSADARIREWRETVARYESEPNKAEGRKELMQRALAAKAKRDLALAADNNFDLASAALQLAIVLASASIVLGVALLAWGAGALGLVAAVLAGFGWFAPNFLPL